MSNKGNDGWKLKSKSRQSESISFDGHEYIFFEGCMIFMNSRQPQLASTGRGCYQCVGVCLKFNIWICIKTSLWHFRCPSEEIRMSCQTTSWYFISYNMYVLFRTIHCNVNIPSHSSTKFTKLMYACSCFSLQGDSLFANLTSINEIIISIYVCIKHKQNS